VNDHCVKCDAELGLALYQVWLKCVRCGMHACTNACAVLHATFCEMEPINDYVH
jgi:hypothetical protein